MLESTLAPPPELWGFVMGTKVRRKGEGGRRRLLPPRSFLLPLPPAMRVVVRQLRLATVAAVAAAVFVALSFGLAVHSLRGLGARGGLRARRAIGAHALIVREAFVAFVCHGFLLGR